MSDGSATYKDLLSLIDLAQKRVKKDFDVNMINEVRIIKN